MTVRKGLLTSKNGPVTVRKSPLRHLEGFVVVRKGHATGIGWCKKGEETLRKAPPMVRNCYTVGRAGAVACYMDFL